MKKIILALMLLVMTSIIASSQTKWSYVTITEGFISSPKVSHVCSVVLSGTLINGAEKASKHPLLNGVIESQTLTNYIVPHDFPQSNQFESALDAMNYLGKHGFELVVTFEDKTTGYMKYILKSKEQTTIKTTIDWITTNETVINN